MNYLAGPSDSSVGGGHGVLEYDGNHPAECVMRVEPGFKRRHYPTADAARLLAIALSLDGGIERATALLLAERTRQDNRP